jgi:hypothetical protein
MNNTPFTKKYKLYNQFYIEESNNQNKSNNQNDSNNIDIESLCHCIKNNKITKKKIDNRDYKLSNLDENIKLDILNFILDNNNGKYDKDSMSIINNDIESLNSSLNTINTIILNNYLKSDSYSGITNDYKQLIISLLKKYKEQFLMKCLFDNMLE